VIAVIGILAAIICPVFASVKEQSRRTKCMNNLRQLGIAFELYCQDYYSDRVAPDYLGLLYPYYMSSAAVYVCPSDGGVYNGKWPTNGTLGWEQMKGIPSGTSYVYYPLVGQEWYAWPNMYGYGLAELPVAACHIRQVYLNREGPFILILTKSASVARTDVWWKVRRGPSQWH